MALQMCVPYFVILLRLMPDDFTCQGESAATQWVKMAFKITLFRLCSGAVNRPYRKLSFIRCHQMKHCFWKALPKL
jgi:hypothetical protein